MYTRSVGHKQRRGTTFDEDSSEFVKAQRLPVPHKHQGQVDTVLEEESLIDEKDDTEFTAEYVDAMLAGKYY